MNLSSLMAFLPELVLLLGALGLFVLSLGNPGVRQARRAALGVAVAATAACVACLGCDAVLFDGAYRVDAFSQLLKLVFAVGFILIVLATGDLNDIRADVKPEYYLFVTLSVCGLTTLVSSVDIITLVIALQLSAFPLYLLVPMRREEEGQRSQMESAIKYVMFGVAANGIMLFGLSYLFGLTGTTHLPKLLAKLQPVLHSPLAIAGLALTFCGLFYKLAVFPFHFWTPDVYQGASNETAGLIASLPKVGAVAVLVRFVSLASEDSRILATLLACLAGASMLYGNLIALVQKDLKRLLGFSGIAHAGYALIGFVTLESDGYAAALYYIVGYLFMVLACFVVICRVSPGGANVAMEDLAGLHRRAPLLALTLVVGIFALAGVPPFVGFMGKLALLKAALSKGYLALVIFAVVNTVIAIYYYLCVVRDTCFREAGERPVIAVSWPTGALCVMLIAGNVLLGVVPGRIIDAISTSLTYVNLTPSDGSSRTVSQKQHAVTRDHGARPGADQSGWAQRPQPATAGRVSSGVETSARTPSHERNHPPQFP